MPQHSPTPWRVVGLELGLADRLTPILLVSGLKALAQISMHGDLKAPEVRANAALVAAAPELKNALRVVARILSQGLTTPDEGALKRLLEYVTTVLRTAEP